MGNIWVNRSTLVNPERMELYHYFRQATESSLSFSWSVSWPHLAGFLADHLLCLYITNTEQVASLRAALPCLFMPLFLPAYLRPTSTSSTTSFHSVSVKSVLYYHHYCLLCSTPCGGLRCMLAKGIWNLLFWKKAASTERVENYSTRSQVLVV